MVHVNKSQTNKTNKSGGFLKVETTPPEEEKKQDESSEKVLVNFHPDLKSHREERGVNMIDLDDSFAVRSESSD